MRRRRRAGWINALAQLNNSTVEASHFLCVVFASALSFMHPFENDLTSCSFCVVWKLQGYATLIRAYVDFLHSKLRYHSNHPEFNGTFDYNEYISLKGIDDPNEGYVLSFFFTTGDDRRQC